MIDCIFILLIFFIVTTAFVEEIGIEVTNRKRRARCLSRKTVSS